MSNCSTTSTTTCYPCQSNVDCDCPYGVVDAGCVQYTGDDLENFDINSGDYLDDILEKLDQFIFQETEFEANSTDSIVATAGGTNGHSPSYEVRIDPDPDNAITVSALGLMVNTNNFGDGKVKVDAGDPKDYLEDQLSPATDGIVTITPTTIAGVIYMVPSINIEALLDYIKIHHTELLCEIVQECITIPGECVGYILTNTSDIQLDYSYLDCDGVITGPFSLAPSESSGIFCAATDSLITTGSSDGFILSIVEDYTCPTTTTTTSTTTTSTSTTTTTTMAENTFQIQNHFTPPISGPSMQPFDIYLSDSVSLINYVVDTTTGEGQTSTYTYTPLSSTADITIQRTTPLSIGIIVTVDAVVVYNSIQSVGNLTIPALDSSGGTTMVLHIYDASGGTTTSTTTTSTTTTSSSTTTTTTTP